MKSKLLFVLSLIMVLVLNACSPFAIVRSTGEQPVAATEPVSASYQPITVDDVQMEVGVGSPIPVHVIVSGNLPDLCSQVDYTEIKQDGTNFIINLQATPYVEGCVKDTLPFKMGIPLNVVGLPGGSYSVTVNGKRADFKLDIAPSDEPLRTAEMPVSRADIQVPSVSIDVGYGSPIPMHAIVSLDLPGYCAQLGEVRMHRAENTFFIRLVAYLPQESDCNPDTLPFLLQVPLNIVNLPEGTYEVNVNGTSTTFDLPVQ